MSLKQFRDVIDINLTGMFLTVRECAECKINHKCKGLICLVSCTGSLDVISKINYPSTKAAIPVSPTEFTAEFFRRGLSNKIFCEIIGPGYVTTSILEEMNQKGMERMLANLPIGRMVDSMEVTSWACELYRNKALIEDFFYERLIPVDSKK
jgi:3-oxoacyl-[acyl-carrier protein] reductase